MPRERTNIYLDTQQLQILRELSERTGMPVAVVVRAMIDDWLRSNNVRAVQPDEWQQRFDRLFKRRQAWAQRNAPDPVTVNEDVLAAIREVRAESARQRRREAQGQG